MRPEGCQTLHRCVPLSPPVVNMLSHTSAPGLTPITVAMTTFETNSNLNRCTKANDDM